MSKEITQDHEQALAWARKQTFPSVAARYAKLCAEAYDIARASVETNRGPKLLQLPRHTLAKDDRQREVYVLWPSDWDEFVLRFNEVNRVSESV